MNQGIKKAKGRYLIHLHADDYLFDINVLQDTYDYLLSNPRLDWIYGQIQTIEKNAKPIGIYPRHKLLQIASPTLLKYTNFIPHQAVFIKKEVFKKFGLFNEKLSSKMDLDYWLKIKNKTTWQFYPKVISNFTIHSSAQSSSKKFLTENLKNLDQVLRASLSKPEYLLANQLYKIQLKINKVIR